MKDDINQDITFRKLSVFMMFMAKGNIARTAEAMQLSGVSVHRALHTLEEGVGCPLFIHKGRNLLPLPAAWTLLEYCQDVMSLMTRGLEATRKVAGVGQGRLRIGTLYSLTLETVPRIIMGMKLRRPELELDLTMGSNQMLLDMLEDDALDAILIATNEGEFNNSAFDVVPLFEDDIFLAARRRNSWIPPLPPSCAITPGASLFRWRKGLPPMPDFRTPSRWPDSSLKSSPGLTISFR
ncbi:malonate utilization transcriptional regulator [Klebsiella michiganensis]|nr:malonate utilization transcriptional regulator [Klebsiella michiganensis]